MTPTDLRNVLSNVDLPAGHLATLLDVTPRAVAFWLTGERTIPGPVEAYLRVFRALPPNLRSAERSRVNERKPSMREGMYAVVYHDESGKNFGYATVLLEGGQIHGADAAGSKYDGSYAYDKTVDRALVHLKVTVPPDVAPVFAMPQPFEWAIDMTTSMDPRSDRGFLELTTALGQKIQAQHRFLRDLPGAAM